ncbi:cytochrome C oxidase assembly protein subunit 17 [Colletotrichum tofieldiae]|uniref:Cytochrome C oxidase assembly protein subunit 17 n=2 Tax=Colletotrichum spaethianum species complex TaxID=2707349 RepID=A0A166TBV5_9PEZI|nr:cytochrome C oxidase assembly protein subunit 17 [Colletotrichum tofieldiae]GJC80266.1 cytochrome c oxidase copper chaperone [Colletotrichum liriopes]GKT54758.1 cytochrome C oxidase assembly protein subunit 17 [Colletotrichum tofieldiae]GKT75961.1 cytochrome C oxidase assembly protein subunit 17 [Colletotrichum tofieldiae]GKT83671.1 cytochrome C oxidase assembly protein subunit 17 [Colletotrichum tofieldiae]
MASSAAAIPSLATTAAAPAAADQQASKPKVRNPSRTFRSMNFYRTHGVLTKNFVKQPCCVCKEEKAKRDECMLFSNAADATKDCLSTIDQYRACMKGFGFTV